MKERIAAPRSVWRSSPIAAKVAFGTATVTFVYYLLFAITTAVLGAMSTGRFSGLSGPVFVLLALVSGVMAFVMLAAWAVGPQIIIGLALRARSSIARWAGTVLAALVAAVVALALISGLTNPPSAEFEQTGIGIVLEYLLWAPFIAIGAVYAVVAVLGFRDAASGGGQRKSLTA